MSQIVEKGRTPEGIPYFGYAPEPPAVPAQFLLVQRYGRIDLVCDRDGCDWEPAVAGHEGVHLTEVVARAMEHVQEAHRG